MLYSLLIKNDRTINRVIRILIPIVWFTLLLNTSSYSSVYFYIVIYYLIVLLLVKNIICNNRENTITTIFACIFSFLITIANYDIYNNSYYLITKIFGLLLIFVTGVFLFYYILLSFLHFINKFDKSVYVRTIDNRKKVFIYTFILVFVVYIITFFLIGYPGYISEDGMSQIYQIETSLYSNHHPIWHTFLIKIFYDLGFLIFKNKNAAIALYMVFQIAIYSAIVSYANSTISSLGINKILNKIFCLSFVLIPYFNIYSFTLLKDVPFSLCFLLLATCYIRIKNRIGNKYCNIFLLFTSFVGIGLFRTNGKFILLMLLIIIIFLCRSEKIYFFSLLISIITVLSLNFYSTTIMKIPNADFVESISIPIQQVSRVIADNKEITQDELSKLDKIVNVNEVKKRYNSGISDPIKKLIRESGDENYLEKNIFDYAILYLRLGLKNPIEYMDAWIDQTKGFFNGGYDERIYYMTIVDNEYGIYSSYISNFSYKAYKCYNELFSKNTLQFLMSIGLQVWIDIVLLYIGKIKKNRTIMLLSAPNLLLIISLLIATPVYAEFRYAYSLFVSNMFLIICSIYLLKNNSQQI